MAKIVSSLGYSRRQVYYVKNAGPEPATKNCGRKPAISEGLAKEIVNWVVSEPRNRFVPYRDIPRMAHDLGLEGYGERAIKTAVEAQGYRRRTSKK